MGRQVKINAAAMVCVLALLSCVHLCAQRNDSNEDSNTRSVQGVVTDASDHPLAKAVVQLEDTKTLQIRSFITESDGSYHFAGLSTNVEYELKAKLDNASSSKKTLDVFNTKKIVTINLKLHK